MPKKPVKAKKPKPKARARGKGKPGQPGGPGLLTPSESQKLWSAAVLLLLLLSVMAYFSGEIHPTAHGYRAGLRDLRGHVEWWLDVESGHWPRLRHPGG